MMLSALVLGIFAWGIAGLSIHRSLREKNTPILLSVSAVFCAMALLCSLFQVKRWIIAEDLAALTDCIRGILFGGITLIAVEAILLLAAAWACRNS